MILFAIDKPSDPRIAHMFTASPTGGSATFVANQAVAHLAKQEHGKRGIKFLRMCGLRMDDADKARIIAARSFPPEAIREMRQFHRSVFTILLSLNIKLDMLFVDEDMELGSAPPDGVDPMTWYEQLRSITASAIRQILCEPFIEVYGELPFAIRYYDLLSPVRVNDKNDNPNAHSSVGGKSCLEAYTWTNDPAIEWRSTIRQRNQAATLVNPVLCVSPLWFCGDDNQKAGIVASKEVQSIQKTKLKHLVRCGVDEKAIYWNPKPDNMPDMDKELADLLIPLKPSKPGKPLGILPPDATEIRTGTLVARRAA